MQPFLGNGADVDQRAAQLLARAARFVERLGQLFRSDRTHLDERLVEAEFLRCVSACGAGFFRESGGLREVGCNLVTPAAHCLRRSAGSPETFLPIGKQIERICNCRWHRV